MNKRSKHAAVEDTNSNEEHQPVPPIASPPKPSVSEVVEISPPQATVAPAKPPLQTRPSKLPSLRSRPSKLPPPPTRLSQSPPRHNLIISPQQKRKRRSTSPPNKSNAKNKAATANTHMTPKKRRVRRKAQVNKAVEESFAVSFPLPKSPHHKCTYDECHTNAHMFYNKSSEKCNKCSQELHHVCMIDYAAKLYGEDGERVGMKKLCKSCIEGVAKQMKLKKVAV